MKPALMAASDACSSSGSPPPLPNGHLHLYRYAGSDRYVASARPLRRRPALLQPAFDERPVPAVICRAFIRQYTGEFR